MLGIVTSTGMNTYFGKTAKLVDTAVTVSHFQKVVLKIGNSDKNGTLTQNILTMGEPILIQAENKDDLIIAAAPASAPHATDVIDSAILNNLPKNTSLS